MDIADLDVESEDVSLEARVVDIRTPRLVNGKYGQKRITLATLDDGTGTIDVTLWEEQIDGLDEGATVRVEGAYTREWGGDLQLNIPRSGSIRER